MIGRILPAFVVICFIVAPASADPRAKRKAKPAKVVKTRVYHEHQHATPQSGQRIFVDPVTRKVRQPTAEEARELGGGGGAPFAQREIFYSDGSVEAVLGESAMVEITATVSADGTISTHCNQKGGAAHTHAAPAEVK